MTFYVIKILNHFTSSEINCHFCFIYTFFIKINTEIDEVCRSEDIDGTKHTSCLNSCFSMMLYMIRVLDYSTSSEISCYFCFTYTFFSVEMDGEIDEICRSEDIDGTKYTFCLNFCSSMTLYMIRVLDYSVSSKINCRFCFTYVFSSVVIEVEIDEVYKLENIDGTKHESYLNSCSFMKLYMIRVSDYSTSSEINFHFCSMYVFFFVEIDTEIDDVRRSEGIDGTKHTSFLNSCSSMTVYMIKISYYFISLKIICYFYSI
jgi:hypothetical protein